MTYEEKLTKKALEYGAPDKPPLSEDEMIDAVAARLAERLGLGEEDLAKGIAPEDGEDSGHGDLLQATEDAEWEAIRNGIEKGVIIPNQVRMDNGGLVDVDEVTKAILGDFAETILDLIRPVLPIIPSLAKALTEHNDLLTLVALQQQKVTKAIGAGVTSDAVANYGRRETVPAGEPATALTGTPLSKGAQGAVKSALAARILSVPAQDRRGRLTKALDGLPGRVSQIDAILYNAAQIPDAERDGFIAQRINPEEIAAILGAAEGGN